MACRALRANQRLQQFCRRPTMTAVSNSASGEARVSDWDERIEPIRIELERITDIDGAQGRAIDDLFVAWFVRAHTGCLWEQAFQSLTGHSSEKGLDAVLVDHRKRSVLVVQGKLRRSMNSTEKRNDVLAFARLTEMLALHEGDERRSAFFSGLDATASNLFEDARRGAAADFRVEFAYLTTGSVSPTVLNEGTLEATAGYPDVLFSVFDGPMTLGLFEDYRLDVVPRVPYVTLVPVDFGEIRLSQESGVEARALVVRGSDLAAIYEEFDLAIFARNIRGFLGMNAINTGIRKTVETEPEAFFYLNNGVTITCSQISVSEQGGKRRITLRYPQIINGQQTTRSLHGATTNTDDVHVLVRVIVVPSSEPGKQSDVSLVDKIVKATNWQNSISKADLRTNDSLQIDLERRLRELGYQYLRRNENRKDAMRRPGYQFKNKIKKNEMASAVATCDIDGFVYRIGISKAFDPDEEYYDKLFSKDVDYLLNCYWFVKSVKTVGRKKGFMGEAKWLAAHDAWRLLTPELKESRAFHSLLAQNGSNDAKVLLGRMFEVSLRDMKKFYLHSVRGQSPKPTGSRFFRRVTHSELRTWADGSRPESFLRALRAFEESIATH